MGRIPRTRRGYDTNQVVSALQKAIRRSDVDAAVDWAFELDKSGFGAWCWKRLRVIMSEDIGIAGGPGMVADINALYENWHRDPKDGCAPLYIAHACVILSTAPKSRLADWAAWYHNSDYVPRREVPDEALDKHTLAGKQKGRGFQFFMDESSRLIEFADNEEERAEKLDELTEFFRDGAQIFIDAVEHGVPTEAPNPWPTNATPLPPKPGESTTDDMPAATHRLPGL